MPIYLSFRDLVGLALVISSSSNGNRIDNRIIRIAFTNDIRPRYSTRILVTVGSINCTACCKN